MAREIAEQPEALARTLAELLPLRPEIAALARTKRRLLLVARGSSDNAAIYARYLAEVHAGVASALAAPSVATLYAAELDLSDTLAVCVSQSGSTQEIVETLEWAKRCGAATLAVTNVAGSPLAAGADIALITQAGPELAVPATKTYTTQVAALAVAVDALAPRKGTLDAAFDAVPAQAARLLDPGPALDAMVEVLAGTQEVLASGRGLAFGTTLEVALKLEETCLRPVRGLSYADLKHGPIAVVDQHLVTRPRRRAQRPDAARPGRPGRDGPGHRQPRPRPRRRRALPRRLRPGRGRARPARAARAAGAADPGPAAHRAAGPPAGPGPRRPPRAAQGHPDRLRPRPADRAGTRTARRRSEEEPVNTLLVHG